MAARAGRIGLQNLPREIEQAALQRGELPARAQPAARKRRLLLVAGILLLCAAVTAALAAPLLTPYAPDAINAGVRLSPPSAAHLFGTDAFGRDLFTRVVYGARLALKLSVLSVFISAVPGILLGLAAGHAGAPVAAGRGGERMKLALACAVYAQPPAQLLLLDEPANHLDLEATQALEALLRQWPGTLLVAAHAEAFLRGIGISGRLHAGAGGWCRLPP